VGLLATGRLRRLADGVLVNVRTAKSVVSSAALPGDLVAPVYPNVGSIGADTNCCIGSQQLVTLDLRTDREAKFARLSTPVQTVQRIGRATLLITDAVNELVRLTKGRVHLLVGASRPEPVGPPPGERLRFAVARRLVALKVDLCDDPARQLSAFPAKHSRDPRPLAGGRPSRLEDHERNRPRTRLSGGYTRDAGQCVRGLWT
jgi:hypothetical protein